MTLMRLVSTLMMMVSRQQKRVKQRKLELDCRFETNARLQINTNTINKQINTNTNKACLTSSNTNKRKQAQAK